MLNVNVVVLAGTISAEPVRRRMPSGDEITELRVSVPEDGRRLLPLPVAVWPEAEGAADARDLVRGDQIVVHGRLVRRFYRSGAGARSLMEVVASGVRHVKGGMLAPSGRGPVDGAAAAAAAGDAAASA